MQTPEVSSASIAELVSLAGRTAVVTGGGRGIGHSIARRFAEAGANVVIGDLDGKTAHAAAAEISEAYGRRCVGIEADVAEASSVSGLADTAVEEFGGLRIWVNNAGIYPIARVFDLSEEQWDRVIDVNLKGAFLGGREAAKRMIAGGQGGVILNFSSVSGYNAATIGGSDYVAAKHGVIGLTKSQAVELGPYGIRVLAIAPGSTDTPGTRESLEVFKAMGAEDFLAHQVKPLGRDGVPDDIARVALFCASDLSAMMTGWTLPVEGGTLIVRS